jgi:hypothetical protein
MQLGADIAMGTRKLRLAFEAVGGWVGAVDTETRTYHRSYFAQRAITFLGKMIFGVAYTPWLHENVTLV